MKLADISMSFTCRLFVIALVLFTLGVFGNAQGLNPATPARDYIRLASQVVVIENRTPNQSTIGIESPGPNSTITGTQPMSGWAIDSTAGISRVDIAIDGVSYGSAQYGLHRPDVCQEMGNRAGCPNVGWSITINTAEFANGLHTLTVSALTNDLTPRRSTVRRLFYTSNSNVSATNGSMVQIDSPGWRSTYDGEQTFYGWAIDGAAAISRVSIAIDGVPYGNAQYGVSRPDVCQHLGQHPGCPNVGWAFPLDTSLLAEGKHSLSVTAYTAEAAPRHTTATINFEVANDYGPSINVEAPGWNTAWSGSQTILGWSLDPGSPIGAVAISIDGNSFGLANYGAGRSDVCQYFGNYPGCPNVGWTFTLNTATLPNGPHTLTVTSYTSEKDPSAISQSVAFSTNNANPAAGNGSLGNIEYPSWNNSIAGTKRFTGWVIDDTSSIAKVSYAIDGISYGNATYGMNRPDVCNAYPGRAGCPNVGWKFDFDTARLTDGNHTLTMTAFTGDATPRKTVFKVAFVSKNSQ